MTTMLEQVQNAVHDYHNRNNDDEENNKKDDHKIPSIV